MTETSGEAKSRHRFENMGKRVDQQIGSAMPRLEEEVRKVISYLDDEIIPTLRKNSFQGLRAAAERLRRLADRLDDSQRPQG